MKKLKEIRDKYVSTEMSAIIAIKEIFDTYLISDYALDLFNLSIEHCDYGIYKLRENGEYLMEGEETECYERASEIIKKATYQL